MQVQTTSESTPRKLRTVRQFSELYPAWTEPGIRNLVLNAEGRLNSRGERIPGNGLAEAGAIVRVGRRVLIDEQKWFSWIADQQRTTRRGAGQENKKQSKLVAESGAVLATEAGDDIALDTGA